MEKVQGADRLWKKEMGRKIKINAPNSHSQAENDKISL
jgi:hypothetical protein